MSRFFPRNWPVAVAMALLAGLLLYLVVSTTRRNAGMLVYPLDDTYIHLAISQNLAEHGVWGVSDFGFASAASSLLWPLLVGATFKVIGVHIWVALAWNILFGVGCVLLADRLLQQARVTTRVRAFLLAMFVYAVPLPFVIFAGMEHTAHIFFTLLFLSVMFPTVASRDTTRPIRWFPWVWIVPVLLVAVRYEGFFLIGMVALFLVLQRRRRDAGLLVLLGAVPAVLHAALSIPRGGAWAPNSVLIKSKVPGALDALFSSSQPIAQRLDFVVGMLIRDPVGTFFQIPVLTVLVGTVLLLSLWWTTRRGAWGSPELFVFLTFLGATLGFLIFGSTFGQYRHEAWIVGLGIIALGFGWQLLPPDRSRFGLERGVRPLHFILLGFLGILLLEPLLSRGGRSLYVAERGSTNIFEQQIQMAGFVRQYYDGEVVAANDIGAINYFASIRCVDLIGLATREVLHDRLKSGPEPSMLRKWTEPQGVRLIVVYDSWFDDGRVFPEEWVAVGRWRIDNNKICGSDTVTFYAPRASEAEALARQLREFDDQLPESVHRWGLYLGTDS